MTEATDAPRLLAPLYTIDNPRTGEITTFLTVTPEEICARVTIQPGGRNAPPHVHEDFEESVEVISGTLTVLEGINLRARRLGPREGATIPIGRVHYARNDGAEPVTFLLVVRPARNFERGMNAIYGLGRERRTTPKGIPLDPFDFVGVLQLSESYLPLIPRRIQKPLMRAIGVLGNRLGHRPDFPQYAPPDHPQAIRAGQPGGDPRPPNVRQAESSRAQAARDGTESPA